MTSSTVTAKRMSMPQIKAKARDLGITPGKMKKVDLIRAIQAAEWCTPCYGRSNGECPWLECCWRSDCLKIKA